MKPANPSTKGTVAMSDALILKMQQAVTDYLTPDTYIRKRPGGTCKADSEIEQHKPSHTTAAKGTIATLRDHMFINDMIYFLDSAEHGTNARKPTIEMCGYCKGGTDENVTHCPVCEGSGEIEA